MLYPEFTVSRECFDMNGLWEFWLGTEERPESECVWMPVPSSYNDLYESPEFRGHVGTVCYRRKFTVTRNMLQNRLVLRFGAVTHKAKVLINGKEAAGHMGGFLPFEAEIGAFVTVGENVAVVEVDNIVDHTTLPVGDLLKEEVPGFGTVVTNEPNFDYFNYAGINRPVILYTTPADYVEDVVITAELNGNVSYAVKAAGEGRMRVVAKDEDGNPVAEGDGLKGNLHIENPRLWEPMNAYLYTLELYWENEESGFDVYPQTFGFRSVRIHNSSFLINEKPFYFKGFGKHEDSAVHGRGFDEAVNVKDIGILKWIGANSFRTSHYPYSDEMMRLCDRAGIVVIDETPACGMHINFTATADNDVEKAGNTWSRIGTFEHHKQVIDEMVARDKNHPCVVMWSIANEPASEEPGAYEYFKPLVELAKELDAQKRPVTIVTYGGSTPETCLVEGLCDVLAINRYYGWYDSYGQIQRAGAVLKDELERWHIRCGEKPVMMMEYGTDTIAGFHETVPMMFTEEYQTEFLREYHKVFDGLPYFVGEHIWNFADFDTSQNTRRVRGNRKGLFTRDRKPKSAAWMVKERWESIPDFGYKKYT